MGLKSLNHKYALNLPRPLYRNTILKTQINHSNALSVSKPSHKRTISKHTFQAHTGENPYQCSHCDKAFPTKHNLDLHSSAHTGENQNAHNLLLSIDLILIQVV